MHRVVDPKVLADSIGEDRAEQSDGTSRGTTTAPYYRQSTRLGFLRTSRDACGDIVHETLDIAPGDRGHGLPTEQRDDMASDPTMVGEQRRFLLGDLPPG